MKETHTRFRFIDALRGIAAMAVLLFHGFAGEHTPLLHSLLPSWVIWPLEHGYLGVSIFFVLSGFVISHSLIHASKAPKGLGKFILRRSLRLDPPYWFAIGIGCAALLIKGSTVTLTQVGAHLLYVQDLFGVPALGTVFWTLCLEVQFYLVFALLLLVSSRAVLISAFVISIPLSQFVIWHGLFTNLWYAFLLGVGAYISWRSPRLMRWFLLYIACLATLAVVEQDAFMLTCAATASLVLLAARSGKLGFANWGILQFLGTISYSLYLIHNPVVGFTFRGIALFGNGVVAEVAGYATSVVASIVLATAMYRLIELPSIKLSRLVPLNATDQPPIGFVDADRATSVVTNGNGFSADVPPTIGLRS